MDKLSAVNEILTALGEHPVTRIELKNPTISIILRALTQETKEVQLRGWWFNSYRTILYPDPDGQVQIPDNAVHWRWISYPSHIAQGVLVDTQRMTSDWTISGIDRIEGDVVIEYEFEDLPPVVQTWVTKRALITAYINDFGLEEVVQEYRRQAMVAEQMVMDAHLQYRRYSTTQSPRYQRIRNHIRR